MEHKVANIDLRKLRLAKINLSSGPNQVQKTDVKSILDKNGWFVKQRQSELSSGHQIWSRLTPFQWLTQISGWLYAIKAFVTIFLIDEHSEWNHYLGDFAPAFGKSNLLNIFLD